MAIMIDPADPERQVLAELDDATLAGLLIAVSEEQERRRVIALAQLRRSRISAPYEEAISLEPPEPYSVAKGLAEFGPGLRITDDAGQVWENGTGHWLSAGPWENPTGWTPTDRKDE